jgi:hypothetical protein
MSVCAGTERVWPLGPCGALDGQMRGQPVDLANLLKTGEAEWLQWFDWLRDVSQRGTQSRICNAE